MTTIVALPDRIIADRAMVVGSTRVRICKIFHTTIDEQPALFATAGDSRLTLRFEMAMRAGNLLPDPDELNDKDELNFEAVLVTHRGVTYYDRNYAPYDVPLAAIGSGSDFARGAMAAGATPEKAVELASQLVDGSHLMGEEVHVEILETRKGKKSPQKGTQ